MKSENPISKILASKVLNILLEEIYKNDIQLLIKQKIITPVIQMIYNDLYPYIIALTITMVMILLFTLMTFVLFILYYFRK